MLTLGDFVAIHSLCSSPCFEGGGKWGRTFSFLGIFQTLDFSREQVKSANKQWQWNSEDDAISKLKVKNAYEISLCSKQKCHFWPKKIKKNKFIFKKIKNK